MKIEKFFQLVNESIESYMRRGGEVEFQFGFFLSLEFYQMS